MEILRRSLFVLVVLGVGCGTDDPKQPASGFSYIECLRDTDCSRPGLEQPLYCTTDRLCADLVPTQRLCDLGKPATNPDALLVATLVDRQRPTDLAMERAFILAIDEINRRPFDNPLPKIDLIRCDTGSADDQAQRALQVAVNGYGARAVLGPTRSSHMRRLAEFLTTNNILVPLISPSASAVELAAIPDGRRAWRTAPSDALQVKVMVDAVLNDRRAGLRRVDVLYVDNLYGRSLASAFAIQYRVASPSTFGRSEPFRISPADPGNTDLQLALENIRRDMPSHLVIIADPAEPVVEELSLDTRFQDLLVTVQVFMSDTGRSPLVPRIAYTNAPYSPLSRFRGSSPAIPTTKASYLRFRANYEDAYPDEDLETQPYAAAAYDAAYVLAIAAAYSILPNRVPRNIPTGADIIAGLERIQVNGSPPYDTVLDYGTVVQQIRRGPVELQGVIGKLAFDLNGDLVGPTNYEVWGLDLSFVPIVVPGYTYIYGVTVP
jgi:hypothetical protein